MLRMGFGLAIGLMAWAPASFAEMARYTIDRDHAVIAFMVDHLGYGSVLGRFTDFEGSFDFDPDTRELGQVSVTIGAASVQSDHDGRDNHVRGKDFLDVGNHPHMSFTANGGEPSSETTGMVTGELTILGQSHPLTLEVTLNQIANYPFAHQKETIGVSARGVVQRSAYGMDYAVANGFVGDEVQLIIEFEANRVD
ncbi:MAG: YceI family protein [Mangrovicoccus sp.]